MRKVTKIFAVLLCSALLICLLPWNTEKSYGADKYKASFDKIVEYILKYGNSGKLTLDNDTSIYTDYSFGEYCITIRYSSYVSDGYDDIYISFFPYNCYNKIYLHGSFHRYVELVFKASDYMEEYLAGEYLYKNSKGKRFKYRDGSASWEYLYTDELEPKSEKIIKNVSKILKEKAGITFKPIKSLKKYSLINEEYHETNSKCKCTKNSIYINENTLSDMKVGDKRTFYFNVDLNGDKKKEKVSVITSMTYVDRDFYSSSYKYTVKINNNVVVNNEWGPISGSIEVVDLDPKDKYLEIKVEDNSVYTIYDTYRYDGKKIKKVESYSDCGG